MGLSLAMCNQERRLELTNMYVMKRYDIVNKIIIEDDSVFLSKARSDIRPLDFQRTADPLLTDVYQKSGLLAMLSIVLRRVYRGEYRLRAQSKITRALRESLHAFPLELIGKLDEDTVVYYLSVVAEKILGDPDYEPAEELQALLRQYAGDAEQNSQENVVRIKLFGQIELHNSKGNVVENPSRQSLPWMLLKYLLVDPEREVELSELLQVGIWPASREEVDEVGAARVRLRRLRDALRPLGLDGKQGLVTFSAGKYKINPQYVLQLDTTSFLALMEGMKNLPPESADGLRLCREALELFRGPFMDGTEDEAWLKPHRDFYHQEFQTLVRATLERCALLNNSEVIPLLCRRAAAIVPWDEALQQEIIAYLVKHQRESDLMQHMTRLIRSGKADWICEE